MRRVAKYEAMWEDSGARRELLKRIVEYRLETNSEAATRGVEKGLDHNTRVEYVTPAAKAIYEKVEQRRGGPK